MALESSSDLVQFLSVIESHFGSAKTLISTDQLLQAETSNSHYIILTKIANEIDKSQIVVISIVSPQHNIRSTVVEIPATETLEFLDQVKGQLLSFLNAEVVAFPRKQEEPKTSTTVNDAPTSSASSPSIQLPSAISKRPNDMPDFDDEYETRAKGSGVNPSLSNTIEDNKDLYPGGVKYPSIKPYLDPTGGNLPSPSSGAFIGGGMIPTPNDRLFGHPKSSGVGQITGVPPGARYDDPYGEEGRSFPGATNSLYGTEDVNSGLSQEFGGLRRPQGGPPGFSGDGSSLPGFGPGPGSGAGRGGFGFGSGSGNTFGNF
ncbi:uncharacterized protein KQ657_004143 [Scheffersomyces spartinae]|uniref:PI31 proteasome regulator C-terminal domain-containing protein n=1 Tax=Scheffersomyces spartinae TaxID=45513 RepID=A0A9P8AJP5_9ASCO|nr:uncharacterized protein KQ657_004143 [Scheffersomyces spartinae]KAG7195030.1 hypothetical protein KQ657_004143 [Scheffersomyces spartinae]